jgi:small subunit ribosomal protein S13
MEENSLPEEAKPNAATEEGKKKAPGQKKEGKEAPAPKKEIKKVESENFRYIVRLANTDLDGHKSVEYGLTGIKGINVRVSTVIARRVGIPLRKKMGDLTDAEITSLQDILTELPDMLPTWMCNRPRDIDSGEDMYLISQELDIFLQDDLNRLKKIRSYKGVRHEQGKKVRGQRTSSNGRKGTTLGVIKKKEEPAGPAKKGE